MSPIFLVIGPPAVGKSTPSRALAAHFRKSIHIPVDNIRDMVVSGLVLPGAVWSDELIQQLALARTSVCQIALTYHQGGFAVVIDDFWNPNHRTDYQALLSHPQIHKVILYPLQLEAHQRNLNRSGESPARAYIDEGIESVYQQLSAAISQLAQDGWVVMDTTTLSVGETVTAILKQTTGES